MILTINGKRSEITSPSDANLLTVLREELDLTGTKYGCGEAACGACMVLIDGKAVPACVTRINSLEGKSIETIEGLEKNDRLHKVQEAVIGDQVKVLHITEAFECGAIINPAHLHSQIMGSIVQGLGGALFESIDFAGGKILNSSFSSYRLPRFSDLPEIEIVMIDRKDLPSAGAGEAPIIGVAPAIRNAILDATGVPINNLPLIPNVTVVRSL